MVLNLSVWYQMGSTVCRRRRSLLSSVLTVCNTQQQEQEPQRNNQTAVALVVNQAVKKQVRHRACEMRNTKPHEATRPEGKGGTVTESACRWYTEEQACLPSAFRLRRDRSSDLNLRTSTFLSLTASLSLAPPSPQTFDNNYLAMTVASPRPALHLTQYPASQQENSGPRTSVGAEIVAFRLSRAFPPPHASTLSSWPHLILSYLVFSHLLTSPLNLTLRYGSISPVLSVAGRLRAWSETPRRRGRGEVGGTREVAIRHHR